VCDVSEMIVSFCDDSELGDTEMVVKDSGPEVTRGVGAVALVVTLGCFLLAFLDVL